MIRLPPTLRWLVADNSLHEAGHARLHHSLAQACKLTPLFNTNNGAIVTQNRGYATSAPEPPAPTPPDPAEANVLFTRDTPKESTKGSGEALDDLQDPSASKILRELTTARGEVDDAVYDKFEKEILMLVITQRLQQVSTKRRTKLKARVREALAQEDATKALRPIVFGNPHAPAFLRAKLSHRLGEASATDNERYYDLPDVVRFFQTEAYDDTDKAAAREMIDTLCAVRCFKREARQLLMDSWVQQAFGSDEPLRALRLVAMKFGSDLPRVLRESINAALKKSPSRDQDKAVREEPTEDSPAPEQAALQLFDFKHILSTCPLPTLEQYPHAIDELCDPKRASSTIHNGCGKAKLLMESEVNMTIHNIPEAGIRNRPAGYTESIYHRCALNLSIEGICTETAYAESCVKSEARQAAWLYMMSKLHMSGALAQIFPSSDGAQSASEKGSGTSNDAEKPGVDEVEADDIDEDIPLEPVELDKRTLEEEKDAKIEIYNYAAGLGFVPRFEGAIVQPRQARAGRKRSAVAKSSLYRVSIRLEELAIDTVAFGLSLRKAEIAAGLQFKMNAESKHCDRDGSAGQPSFRALSTDTAKQFLQYCNSRDVELTLQMEVERVQRVNEQYQATLTANGSLLGQQAVMGAKKDAQDVAYLLGALEVAKEHPSLVQDFERELRKGNGKILKAVETIDLPIEPAVCQTMRNALVEAHAAGLPMSQNMLAAEESNDEEQVTRSRRALDGAQHQFYRLRLLKDQEALDSDPALVALREQKAALPMSQYRTQLIGMVKDNDYSIVVGATGSGKTTQVPQLIFETEIRQHEGTYCNIICTQPRRIAATSVAQRVAQERNERLRKTVGYHVRFDPRPPYNPFGITYCTTGILLERLKHDPDGVMDFTSHILIDEVHERDMQIDFLMIVLKKAISTRQAEGKRVPKVVLMSATLDTELFAKYFQQPDGNGALQPAPCLSVPGRIFPVKEKYLGSIMHELLEEHGKDAQDLIDTDSESKEFLNAETIFSSDVSGNTSPRPDSAIDWKRERSSVTDADGESNLKEEKEAELVPVGLLSATIAHICATSPEDGAILAFLPGLHEITRTEKTLLQAPLFGLHMADASKFKICLLHSSLTTEQQNEIFEPTPAGCRKIILATNIAETSVTVTDVKYVVDTGKLRENRYDQLRRITKLQCVWESKSNSRQRIGRAGRVSDGNYYALFSKERADSLKAVGLPELLRSDLQETCLSIKSQNFNEPIASFLSQAIEPPSNRAVDAAIKSLTDIQAFTADEELTALGRVLSSLPVHPTLGKMIVLGVIFRCLDAMIMLGAAAEERPLFISPLLHREEAQAVRRSYANKTESDHLAQYEAFKDLRQVSFESGFSAVKNRAREKLLHFGAFRTIDQTSRQIVKVLVESGLVPAHAASDGLSYGGGELNTNSDNYNVIKSLLLAGSHPNLAVKLSTKGMTWRTPTETDVLLHPSSVIKERKSGDDKLRHAQSSLLTFSSLNRSTDGKSLFLRSATKVSPLMAILFGGQLRIASEKTGKMGIDEWLRFRLKGYEREYQTKLVLEFRKALGRVLHRAYASLANVRGSADGDEGEGERVATQFADDPVREMFAKKVVEVLDIDGGRTSSDGWPSEWGSP